MKILVPVVRFPPSFGGVETTSYSLGKELVKKGHDIDIICAREPLDAPSGYMAGMCVNRLPTAFKIANTNICPTLVLEVLKHRFDLVHIRMPTPWFAELGMIIAKLRRRPILLSIHSDIGQEEGIESILNNVYSRTFYRKILDNANIIVVNNPSFLSTFEYTGDILNSYRNKIVVIPNGFDPSLFHVESNMEGDKQGILFVSVLDKYHRIKGLHYLIDAIPLILKKYPETHLTVVGDGELRAEYEEQVRRCDLTPYVTFLGSKSKNELKNIYNRAKLLVLPSYKNEVFGNVLVEALACGTPVVTTKLAGIAHIIESEGVGKVAEMESTSSLAQAIIEVLDSFEDDLVQKCARFALSNYTWSKVAEQYERVYQKLLNDL